MYKLYLTLFMCILLLGCEVRVRDTGTSILGNSRSSNDTLFSIGRGQNNQGIAPLSITESQTTVQAQVLNASPTSNMYEIVTPFGNMTIRLYDETPAHRDNFKKLAESGFYDGTTFHRVIGNFMIQGGDPNSKDNDPNNDGIGGPGYTTNAELNDRFFHKKGAIAAARQPDQVNPQRRSSGSQFYIVQGRAYEEQELSDVERYIGIQIRDNNFRFSPEAREAYKSRGGYPTLDMQYTVFGELVDGFDVLDRISTVPVDGRDRPKDNIPMTIRAIRAQ